MNLSAHNTFHSSIQCCLHLIWPYCLFKNQAQVIVCIPFVFSYIHSSAKGPILLLHELLDQPMHHGPLFFVIQWNKIIFSILSPDSRWFHCCLLQSYFSLSQSPISLMSPITGLFLSYALWGAPSSFPSCLDQSSPSPVHCPCYFYVMYLVLILPSSVVLASSVLSCSYVLRSSKLRVGLEILLTSAVDSHDEVDHR